MAGGIERGAICPKHHATGDSGHFPVSLIASLFAVGLARPSVQSAPGL